MAPSPLHPLCLSILAALAAPAFAADDTAPADARELDRVTVVGDARDSQSSTATRMNLTLRETPQSVSVIDRATLDAFGLTSVNQALGLATGIQVEQVETDRAYFTARGFDITNFQTDCIGLPMPYGLVNGDIDLAIYDRIEVLRGANGLMSSTGNPSATINFIRKRPTPDLQADAALTVGSWNNTRLDVDVSGGLANEGAVRGRAVAAFEQGDNYLDRYSRDKQVYYGILEADLGEATTLAVGASHQRNRPEGVLWGALPLFYSDGTPTDYDVSTSTAADWSHWDTDTTYAFAELQHDFAGQWQAKATVNYQETEENTELFYVSGTPDRATGLGLSPFPSAYDSTYRAHYADIYASGPLTLLGRSHDVVVGGNWARGNVREVSRYSDDVGPDLPPLELFDGYYPKPVWDAPSAGSDFDLERESLYATVRWNLSDSVKLITGASRTHAQSIGDSYGVSNSSDETKTTPFAGLVIDLAPNYSLYGSYGEIFNPQSELDENHQFVGALTGSNAEVGLKGAWKDNAINASIAVFRARQDNLAEFAGYYPGTFDSYYQGTNAESRGIEFDMAGRITDTWTLSGGITHMQLVDEDGQNTRDYVPRDTFRVATTVEIPQVAGLSFGGTLRWQSQIHVDDVLPDGAPVRVEQDAYALLGLMARYEFADRWTATLNLDNVTDEKYYPSLYWNQAFWAAPRNVSLTVAYRFQ
ncbi:TonB-dependent siderophore receptor [Noviluteimonas gilva]|uniref:TonB-dependent siderophore receptor n=1 Tax=Noviluteimonas gilva TaxID=2682097 RepID=UPI0012E91E48|nr:TonB-dependent siderophore receptor [Lysobacter gilvus]